jgi:hypothetical protein
MIFPVLDTPERRGHEAAMKLLSDIMAASLKTALKDEGLSPPLHKILDEEIDLVAKEYGTKIAGAVVRAHDAMSDVIRDLGWPQELGATNQGAALSAIFDFATSARAVSDSFE